MKLKAVQKRKKTEQNEVQVQPEKLESPTEALNQPVQIYYNTLHYNTLQKMIEAQHNGGDYTYSSVSDLIRAGLAAHQQGMPLRELDEKGSKSYVSVRLTQDLKAFYDTLPSALQIEDHRASRAHFCEK